MSNARRGCTPCPIHWARLGGPIVKYPIEARGLHLSLNSLIIPDGSTDGTIGCLTSARYQLAQHFYTARPLVAETHMLLNVQTVAPHW